MQHLITAPLPESIENNIFETLDFLCEKCEIDDGPASFDFILNDDGIYVIEMSARVSGNGLPVLIKKSYGIDDCAMNLKIATDQPLLELNNAGFKAYSALQTIISDMDGIFSGIGGLEAVKEHPAFSDARIFVNPGESVHRFTHEGHKLGYVIMSHPELEILKEGIQFAQDTLKIELCERMSALVEMR
jgi:predicted ATP-grasp superfamily ATP-dependent carboligase